MTSPDLRYLYSTNPSPSEMLGPRSMPGDLGGTAPRCRHLIRLSLGASSPYEPYKWIFRPARALLFREASLGVAFRAER